MLLIALITFGSWICSLGCSTPLSPVEEKFLGTWGTTLIDEEGVEVIVIWEFVFEYGTRRVVFNEIYRDNKIVSRRKGEWHVKASNTLRVVLDNENLHISDNYENSSSSGQDEGFGELIGSIFGEVLTALTDDEYNIEYYRKGNELYLKWYNEEFHAYQSIEDASQVGTLALSSEIGQ